MSTLAALLAVIVSRGSPTVPSTPGVLEPLGPEGARVENLWWLFFWVCTAVYVIVIALLVAGVLRRRRELTPEGRKRRTTAVIVGAVVSAVILFVFLFADVSTGRAVLNLPADALHVEVTGHQWWWEVKYPAEPPSDIVTTANELHVPVGRPVVVVLQSDDVIHSFWIPNLNGKRDAIPGRRTELRFQAARPGIVRGECAEFCGYQHAHMAFLVVAESPAEFDAYLAAQRRPAAEPTTPEQHRGRQVFLSAPCVLCHSITGTPAFGRTAPDLTHVASRLTLAAGTLPNAEGPLGGWIVDPQRIKPGNHMPPNLLPPADLMALLSYLENLK